MKITSREDALAFTKRFCGKIINRVWRGNGTAIFLEVGHLTDRKGELTIMIEWSWRVEKHLNILFGSWSDESLLSDSLKKLKGLSVESISFQSRLPELVIELSNEFWVCSFSTVEGNPEWALITSDKTLHSRKGKLVYE